MRTLLAGLLWMSLAACTDPVGPDPTGAADPALSVTTQAKPVPGLVIELVSGNCASGMTVRVRGENLSPRSRFGNMWLRLSNLTSLGPAQVQLDKGNKKSVEWTVFWPAEAVNPVDGPKFTGDAKGVVTDAYTGWVHETPLTPIGPAC